jgi:hypothetical protein
MRARHDDLDQSQGGRGHSDLRSRKQRSLLASGQLQSRELTVGMLGEGEGASDSILVLTEEWKMVEGQLIDSAHSW